MLLELINSRSSWFGERVTILPIDFPFVHAKHNAEVMSLLEALEKSGDIIYVTRSAESSVVELTLKGVESLEQMRRSMADPSRVFVALWFDREMDQIYDQFFSTAIRNCGYDRPVKMDREHHNNEIPAQMLTEIRLARFVVADFTGHRQNVYFEAGFARGLGKEVVWTCRKDQLSNAHFDAEHFNFIEWIDGIDLQRRLEERIHLTIGPGPSFKPK